MSRNLRQDPPLQPDQLYTSRGFSERYPGAFSSDQAVRRARMLGTGPRFTIIGGRILYRESDIAEWLRSRPSFSSTAEAKVAREQALAERAGCTATSASHDSSIATIRRSPRGSRRGDPAAALRRSEGAEK